MPRVPIASEDERKFIVDGIQVGSFLSSSSSDYSTILADTCATDSR
ncbi:unnamed protein product, partial [Rotaria sp. Silwood2]